MSFLEERITFVKSDKETVETVAAAQSAWCKIIAKLRLEVKRVDKSAIDFEPNGVRNEILACKIKVNTIKPTLKHWHIIALPLRENRVHPKFQRIGVGTGRSGLLKAGLFWNKERLSWN